MGIFLKTSLAKLSILVLVLILCTTEALAVKVVIDAGHGGSDSGAIGVNGLYEKTVNLDIALKVQQELEQMGYQAYLSRNHDMKMDLEERVRYKENMQADLFVSIHANAYHHPSAQGSLILYYDHRFANAKYPASPEMAMLSNVNQRFAQTVLDSLVEQADTVNMGLMPSSAYVIRHGTMPSILVETAFLSNREDAEKLASETERMKMAVGIAQGIQRFYPLDGFRDIAGHWAYEAIVRLNELGIVHGEGHYYYPDRPLTRAEFITILDRVFLFSEEESVNDSFAEQPAVSFHDLNSTHWSFDAVAHAVLKGLIQGYPDGSIRPNQAISRAEVTVLLDRILYADHDRDLNLENSVPFYDVPLEMWYAESVYRLQAASLLNGRSAYRFHPEQAMNRAETAVMIDRYFSRTASH